MTDLEQIAYDNGVVCGFIVARGISISQLPIEHELFKYENWTEEMKAMLILKPYYLMYKSTYSNSYCITFSINPFVYWMRGYENRTYPDFYPPEIRFSESDTRINTFKYNISTTTYNKKITLDSLDVSNGFYTKYNTTQVIDIYYTNGLTSVIENPYNIRKFPLNLIGSATNYYKPQIYTATLNTSISDYYSNNHVTDTYFICHGGDIYAYSIIDGNNKTIYLTNTYLWNNCTTATEDSIDKDGNVVRYTVYMYYKVVAYNLDGNFGTEIYTCTIPVFISYEALTNYLNTGVCSSSDFDYMPSNYYIDSNGKLIKS